MSFKNSRKLTQCLLSNQCSPTENYLLPPAASKNTYSRFKIAVRFFSLIFDRGRIYLSTIKNYLNVAPKLGSKFDQNIFVKNGQK